MSFVKSHPLIVILISFISLKLYHLLILLIEPFTFDLSPITQQITPSSPILNKALNKLIHWDAIYFAKLIQRGIDYEHEWVFSPLWWNLIKYLHLFINDYGIEKVVGLGNGITSLATGLIVSNLSQLTSSYLLFYLTEAIFGKNSGISLKTSMLFLWSTIGVFSTSLYSENFNTLLILTGLYLKYSFGSIGYLLSPIFFSLAFMIRSNCIILGFLYVYDLFKFKSLKALLSGVILGSSVVIVHVLPYLEYCVNFNEKLGQRPWCSYTIPSIFSYAQSNYWNVGFLNYWTPGNIPNFLFALPEIILLYKSSLHFISSSDYLKSLSLVGFVHLILMVFFVHVQIILRVSTFIPLQFWYLSSLLVNNDGKYWILYLIIWNLVEPILFISFLPPA